MKKQIFAAEDFERIRKPTRREQFPLEMDEVMHWKRLCKQIEPFYPKAGNGRPPAGPERMLRMYFLQHRFNFPDPGAEEALYESSPMCRFVSINPGQIPARTRVNSRRPRSATCANSITHRITFARTSNTNPCAMRRESIQLPYQ